MDRDGPGGECNTKEFLQALIFFNILVFTALVYVVYLTSLHWKHSKQFVFYITNEMQLIRCSLLLSALYMFRAVFSAHHQGLIKLYVQPWVLSCFPAVYRYLSTPAIDIRKT